MAPEVLRNAIREPNFLVFQSADVYSFGVILYEILTRKEPFEDDLQYSSIDGSFQFVVVRFTFYGPSITYIIILVVRSF